jgi:probable LLM family oxidoreductase
MTHNGKDTPPPFELGIYSFADWSANPVGVAPISQAQRIQEVLEEIELADQVGLDVYGLGEHHRDDYVSSAPDVILAAAASRTKNIRLTSAVTVLSSDDPVRVFQRFATLDLISNGRAEIMAGRGSFIESFPLFGYNLRDYDGLFNEKLDLLIKLRETDVISWEGKYRPSIDNRLVMPRPVQELLPLWIAVGGTPESVVRAAKKGLPMALAIIGGMPEQFAPFVDLYHRTAKSAGFGQLPISINSHGFIADTREQAINESFGPVKMAMDRIGRERGWSPMTKGQYEASAHIRGANFLGTPDDIIEKILFQHEIFNHQRFLIQLTVGMMPHDKMMHAIELFGTKVAPVVREEIARRVATPEE